MRARAALLPFALAFVGGCAAPGHSGDLAELGAADLAGPDAGAAMFAFDDFGGLTQATLETNALPYKVIATALLMRQEAREGRTLVRDDLPRIFRQFGFLTAERIANWRGQLPSASERPLGLISGIVSGPLPLVRIDAANLGCAVCHAGTLYDSSGTPTREVWLGLPNTSVDVEAFSQAAYAGLRRALPERDSLRQRVESLFPEMGRSERLTLRHLLLRRIETVLARRAALLDAPAPFSNGGPGRTNGVAALKLQLGLLPRDRMHPEHGFTSIPDLSSRGLRSSLLYDGVYSPLDVRPFAARALAQSGAGHVDSLAAIVTFFTVPTMGMTPADAEHVIPRVRDVMRWLTTRYRPPPFPGPIDEALARSGGELFATRCSSCHGVYDDAARPRPLVLFPNVSIAQSDMGTDSVRWASIDSASIRALRETTYGRYMAVNQNRGYVAPILSGLWASAPYLHNGSVPTLWQLLSPAERAVKFQVGGHRLDFRTLGIAGTLGPDGVYRYPAGYEPWATPELYDTGAPGLGNRGHEREFDGLDDGEKRALIEYLKGL